MEMNGRLNRRRELVEENRRREYSFALRSLKKGKVRGRERNGYLSKGGSGLIDQCGGDTCRGGSVIDAWLYV